MGRAEEARPALRMILGEAHRDRVVSVDEEKAYLDGACTALVLRRWKHMIMPGQSMHIRESGTLPALHFPACLPDALGAFHGPMDARGGYDSVGRGRVPSFR